jgi:Gram-negative porin
MRKLLMASAAILGASGSLALAQTANPNQGQLAAPYGAGPAANNNNNAWGTANTPTGSTAAGPLSTIWAPNVDAVPAPGTIVIRLNGRVEADVVANFTSSDKGVTPSATGGAPNGFKINPVGVATYLRLYPGFDALAANGLRYGASAEIRTAFFAGTLTPAAGGTSSGLNATNSAFAGTGSQSSASGNTSAESLFVRRVFTYLAADNVGIVRIGQTDGVVGLFDPCIFSSSCWDAGVGTFQGGFQSTTAIGSAGGGGTSWPWLAQAGNEYGNAKIVYLTPQFFGFDFGVQYAPSMGNAYSDNTQTNPNSPTLCNQASATCISVTSGDDPQRWYNQVGVGARFQRSFGAVDFKAYGFYETAGKEDWTATSGAPGTPSLAALKAIAAAPGTAAFRSGGNANFYNYDNLSFYQAGLAVTAMNFTAAVSYIGGAYDGQMAMRPTGGAPENAFLYGLTYANGPLTAGVDVGVIDSQGATQLVHTSQRRELELGFGGAYRLAPGVQLVGEYQYVQRHQGGFDFNTGAVGTSSPSGAAGSSTRDAHGQGFLFSTVMTW